MVSIKLPQQTPKKEKLKNGKTKKAKIQKTKNILLQKQSPPKQSELVLSKPVESAQKKKRPHFNMPSKIITDDLVTSCLVALEKLTTHYNKKNAIFGDETQIFMEIRCIKIATSSKCNIKLVLPHSTVSSSGEVCLVTPDLKKGRKVDHEPTVGHWEDTLRAAGVTSVKTVLPMRQLRVEYDQFELKRRLMTQHDFIMVDSRVLNHVSHILGKIFFQKHNMLIPIKMHKKKDLKKCIDTGLRSVMLRLNEGQTSTVLVGHTAMSQSQLKENILALVGRLKERFPGGEANIRSLSIKLPLSLSLPLYLTLRPSSSIPIPRIKKSKPKSFIAYEDELTTKPGSTVQVQPDGTVHLRKLNKTRKEEIDEEDDKNESGDDEDNKNESEDENMSGDED